MYRWGIFTLVLLNMGGLAEAGPKHRRDEVRLPEKEKEFAIQLSLRQRKIFCGQFNHLQRDEAIKYARGRGQDKCYTPDEAVLKVMEESGMSLTLRGRPQSQEP